MTLRDKSIGKLLFCFFPFERKEFGCMDILLNTGAVHPVVKRQ